MPMEKLVIVLFTTLLSFGVNYIMALLGEPRALWLMQLLGVL